MSKPDSTLPHPVGSSTTIPMSSLDIAAFVEVSHDKVQRIIELLAARKVIRPPTFEVSEEANNLGWPPRASFYNLEKRDAFVVVAQLSPEFTARMVDRWQALEAPHAGTISWMVPNRSEQ